MHACMYRREINFEIGKNYYYYYYKYMYVCMYLVKGENRNITKRGNLNYL